MSGVLIIGHQGLYTNLIDSGYCEALTSNEMIINDNIQDDQDRLFKQVDAIQTMCDTYDSVWRDRLENFQQEDMIENKRRYQYQDKVVVTLHKC